MRLGYWVSEKKSKKLNFEDFGELCRNAGFELVKINLDISLETQGPFDIIIHKITDVLAKVGEGCAKSKQRMQHFQDYTLQHPECVVVDPLDSIYKLLDRYEQYKVVQQCDILGDHVFAPAFVELTTTDVESNKKKLRKANIQYPIVCKPTVAHGSQFSHQMLLVFNDGGLVDIQPPCVAQTFVNHGARLYKIFVIGETMRLVERPSLRNLSAGDHKTIFFDAQDVSKPYSCHDLNVLDEANDQGPVEPNLKKMQALSDDLRSHLGMNLFGVDVIIDCETERYGVIDINFFPGYEGVPEFFPLLLKLSQRLLVEREMQRYALGCNNNEEKADSNTVDQDTAIPNCKAMTTYTHANGHVKLPIECGNKRLILEQKENGVNLSVEERVTPAVPNGSANTTTTLVANGNSSAICLSCKASNGKECNGSDLENGFTSVRSNGLITGEIDRQLL